MRPTVSVPGQRLFFLAVGAVLAVAPVATALGSESTPRLLAECHDIVDTTDSFSMNCVPTIIPDTSDQLTEAEVAEPGWNAVPGGGAEGRR